MRSKKAIYNVATNLLLQLIVIMYGFIVPKLIINTYGSNVNGLVSSITQFLSYVILLESGIGPVVKASLYKPLANKNKNELVNIIKSTEKFFKIISYIFIVYVIGLSILYPMLVTKEFDTFFSLSLIIIISISIFAEYYFGMTYRLVIQADQKSYVISIIQIITYMLSIIAILIMAKMNVSIHILKLVSGLIFVLRPLAQKIYIKKMYKLDFSNYDKNYKLKNKWDGLAQHVAAVIHGNTDITLLTFCSTLVNVSIYSVYGLVTKGIRSIIQSFSSGIDASWGDMIAKKERDNLNKKFSIYEVVYLSVTTFIYSATLVLIIPFIKVYTFGIKDANYVLPSFGFLIVLSEYIWAIRLPYSSITLAAGHFKETRVGAWIECVVNVVVSLILIWKYELVGVAIGTIVAMVIRTVEFVYHTNKYILQRSIWNSIKKILLVIISTIIILIICNYLPYVDNVSYFNWIINAIIVVAVALIVTVLFGMFFYRNEFREVGLIIKFFFKKKK